MTVFLQFSCLHSTNVVDIIIAFVASYLFICVNIWPRTIDNQVIQRDHMLLCAEFPESLIKFCRYQDRFSQSRKNDKDLRD